MDNGMISVGGVYMGGDFYGTDGTDGMMEETGTSTGITVDGLLSNWFFVGGVSGAVLALSVVIGLLLAKHKIKKGFDVYED